MGTIGADSTRATSDRGSTSVTTTLYELLAALQTAGEPDEDKLIVALVARWIRTGQITFLNSNMPDRQGIDREVFKEIRLASDVD